MKITAEFNSNEELIDFIKIFNQNSLGSMTTVVTEVKAPVMQPKEIEKTIEKNIEEVVKNVDKSIKKDKVQEPKEDEASKEVAPEEDKKEEPKVTREMVRAKFSELIKAGKQKESKDIVSKFGASKLPDIKEEDLPAVLEEAEALLNG